MISRALGKKGITSHIFFLGE